MGQCNGDILGSANGGEKLDAMLTELFEFSHDVLSGVIGFASAVKGQLRSSTVAPSRISISLLFVQFEWLENNNDING